MSDDFANLIGKAMNTPPTGTIKLAIGEQVELKKMDGRLIKLVSLTLDQKDELISKFQVVFEVKEAIEGGIYRRPFSANFKPQEMFKGDFSQDAIVKTNPNDLVYVELRLIIGSDTKVQTALLEYTFGTPY